MKIVAISDTHGRHRQLVNLPRGDILVHGGDVCNRGSISEAIDFIKWFSQLDYQYKIFISGNHDLDLETGECLIPKSLEDGSPFPGNMIFLDNQSFEIDNIKIWGASTEAKVGLSLTSRTDWSAIPRDTNLLMTHYPPRDILDQNWAGKHCGLIDLATRVEEIQPDYHLFGDIHASYGQKRIGKTQFFNGSLYHAKSDRIVNEPFVFEM